ncbi:MAG: TIGR00180 family glycosyltransferase [Alphaproteobacteria bacterium]|nr:TIGR00180 family glycosyltransferase [Alphaproteobacteria bacterium]
MTTSHTLVIPTYNRPGNLGRLLGYLERAGFDSPVLVFDSSSAENRSENLELCNASPMDVTHFGFDEEIHPFVKMREGLQNVRTDFCSACADDDLVFVDSLAELFEVLETNTAYAAVHGNYVNFKESDSVFRIVSVAQRGSQAASENALQRVREFMSDYTVLFYALFRTEVMQACFAPMDALRTTLMRELASSTLAVANGPVVRRDLFYMGRNTDESASYDAWHPHQILATEPEVLFKDFAAFRTLLAETVDRVDNHPDRNTTALLDLLALRYLAPFLRSDVIDFIVQEKMVLNHDSRTTVENLWATFVATPNRTKHPQVPLFEDNNWTFAPGVLHPNAPRQDYLAEGRGPDGSRTYFLHNELFFEDGSPICTLGREATEFLLDEFDRY